MWPLLGCTWVQLTKYKFNCHWQKSHFKLFWKKLIIKIAPPVSLCLHSQDQILLLRNIYFNDCFFQVLLHLICLLINLCYWKLCDKNSKISTSVSEAASPCPPLYGNRHVRREISLILWGNWYWKHSFQFSGFMSQDKMR